MLRIPETVGTQPALPESRNGRTWLTRLPSPEWTGLMRTLMTTPPLTLHPDDLLFFHEVSDAMMRVARDYRLPLRSVSPLPMPASGMADRMGDCTATGHIRIVMRCTVDGAWVEGPLSPAEVWETAAHELAHLEHHHHGPKHIELTLELLTALRNEQVDHRDKVLAKLVKMQAQKEGEAALGNTAAAEAFASAINRMLIEHELNPSEIDYARTQDRDPVIEMWAKLQTYGVKSVKSRVAWQEALANVVARAHLCKFLIRRGTNDIAFVGTKSHATVAEYSFGVLVAAAEKMSYKARHDYREGLRREHGIASGHSLKGVNEGFGFREAWLAAFTSRIAERFDEARKAAVAAADASVPGGTSTALIRLDGQLVRAQKFIDDKFAGRRIRYASSLARLDSNNAAGREHGRAAADRMAIGRKAMNSAVGPKLIGGR